MLSPCSVHVSSHLQKDSNRGFSHFCCPAVNALQKDPLHAWIHVFEVLQYFLHYFGICYDGGSDDGDEDDDGHGDEDDGGEPSVPPPPPQ